MAFSIGRWGLDTTLTHFQTLSIAADGRVQVGGQARFANLAESQANQALLLAIFADPPPEPVVAVVWSPDDSMNGAYRPVPNGCTVERKTLTVNDFYWNWTATLTRLPDYQTPWHVAHSFSSERAGAGGVSEDPWLAYPTDAKGRDLAGGDTAQMYQRTGPGGTVDMDVDSSLAASSISKMRIDPTDWYDMRPKVLVNGYEAAGRGVQAIGNGDDWEITNGLLSIRGAALSTYTLRFRGPVPDPVTHLGTAVYASDKTFIFGGYLAGTRKILRPDHAPEILQCNTERVGIKLTGWISTTAATDQYRLSLYLWLRRGSLYVEGCFESDLAMQHSIKDLAATALAVVTANKTVTSDANDSDGNRLWIASGTSLNTGSVASGEVYATSSAKTLPFGFGWEIGGTNAVAPNTAAEQFDHYWADQTVTWTVE